MPSMHSIRIKEPKKKVAKSNLSASKDLKTKPKHESDPLKITLKIVVILILLSFAIAIAAYPILKLATSCYAKTLCSAVFVSSRNPLSVDIGLECSSPILPFIITGEVDHLKKSVTASLKFFPYSVTSYFTSPCTGCSIPDNFFQGHYRNLAQNVNCTKEGIIMESHSDKLLSDKVKQVVHALFENNTLNTREFVVVKDGKILYEEYSEGFSKDTPLLGWSMSKSILNALIGLRIKEGKLSLDESASKYIPQWKYNERSNITIRDLIQMNSGLQWAEIYAIYGGDVVPMLYSSLTTHFKAISYPAIYRNGTKWYYSSGTTNILSWILRQSFDNDFEYLQYPSDKLFKEIQAPSFVLETDPFGTYVLSSFSYATARDWAKFGLLYLQNGVVNGKKLFTDDWVNFTRSPVPGSYGLYGAHWWRGGVDDNVVGEHEALASLYRPLPNDAFLASGYSGQYVVVIPSQNIVIVRLGYTPRPHVFPIGNVVHDIVEALNA